LEADVDALVELVEARSENRHAGDVKLDAIDATVRDLALPFIKAGESVVVRTSHPNLKADHRVNGANIVVDRVGHYVTLTVHRNVSYIENAPTPALTLPAVPEGMTVESAYQEVVKQKGEAAANAILAAVENAAKNDPETQATLLWQAVSA